jgi:hypothetical protein
MAKKYRKKKEAFWREPKKTMTADYDLDKVLGSVVKLPMRLWRHNFLFFGARDEDLYTITSGVFPAVPVPDKSHPVICDRQLPNTGGVKVYPCSTQKPWETEKKTPRYIRKGCRLLHTGVETDRDSYLLEMIPIRIPSSLAFHLRFRGEVPEECIQTANGQ